MAVGAAARVGARVAKKAAKKAYSKTKTSKKAQTRKAMQARANKRADAVKKELNTRKVAKKDATDRAYGMESPAGRARRIADGPPGRVSRAKNNVSVIKNPDRAQKAAAREKRKEQYLRGEPAKLPSIKKTPSVRATGVAGSPSKAAQKLAADTKKAKAARKAAAARRRKRTAGAGGLSAAAVTARRRSNRGR
jgi:hypothetical protein